MKKVISILLASLMLLSCFSVISFAGEKVYEQPFAEGTDDCEKFRIPSIITLNNGAGVLAAADLRYGHGADSPGNLDTLVAYSKDGYTGWEKQRVNYFDDYAHGYSDADSASFIDPVMVQDSKGTIYLIVDAFPSGGGSWVCKQGTGHVEYEGKDRLALTDSHDNMKDLEDFEYVLGDFRKAFPQYNDFLFAPIIERETAKETGYFVDQEFRLYNSDGSTLWMKQVGAEEETEVQQNIFYEGADFCVQRVMHMWLRTSNDNGQTWSAPTIITPQVKEDRENFFGVGPGKGFVTTLADGTERIIFAVYDNSSLNLVGYEQASTIYSDDGGVTWHRGERVIHNHSMHKTSESQIVELPDGTLRLYSRNKSNLIGYADSTDGGVTWSVSTPDKNLDATADCMVSFINYDRKINGKNAIIASYASDPDGRADGVVRVGLINEVDNSVEWGPVYHINQGFFAYSCLTILPDGNIGILGEHDAAKIVYTVLKISENGEISEVNGNDAEYAAPSKSFLEKIKDFFRNLIKILRSWFGVY